MTGVAVIDEPRITQSGSTGLGGSYYKSRIERTYLKKAKAVSARLIDDFRGTCDAAGVPCQTRCEVGDPVEVLLSLHEDFDLTLLGRETRFRAVTQSQPDEVLTAVLCHARRPVVAVPASVPARDAIILAYDGGQAAADALKSFTASGLGHGPRVSVVAVSRDEAEAARNADEAARYLNFHNVLATSRPVTTTTDEAVVLADEVRSERAGMIAWGLTRTAGCGSGTTNRRRLACSEFRSACSTCVTTRIELELTRDAGPSHFGV